MEMTEFKKKLSEEWKIFKFEWNLELQNALINELNGENCLFYTMKIDPETIEYLVNMKVVNSSVRYDICEDDEIDFKVYTFYNEKEIEFLGSVIPGEEDSSSEEERYDYYNISRCDDDLIRQDQGGGLSTLLRSIQFCERLQRFSDKGEHFNDLVTDKYHELSEASLEGEDIDNER